MSGRGTSRRQHESDALFGHPADYPPQRSTLPPFEIWQVSGGIDVDINDPVLSVETARDLVQALTQAIAAAELAQVEIGACAQNDDVVK
jgi:hypothetical protein